MGTRILVADDEESLRMIISEVLADDGHNVVACANGEEALEEFKKQPCQIVLTDIVMGGMTGLDLLHEIKQISPETLVVIMTSHGSLETATDAIRSGGFDYLLKPFENLDVISSVVNKATDELVRNQKSRKVVATLKRDAEEMETINKNLRDMANKDYLTGLYNQRYFREMLEFELSRATRYQRSFSILFCDVDFFKKYNDTHGHAAGDEVLKSLASIFHKRARNTTLVARYGGEEFVLLAPEANKEDALQFAEGLRQAVAEYPFEGRETQPSGNVTLSIGVSTFPANGKDADSLLEEADKFMYQAKRNGRNSVLG